MGKGLALAVLLAGCAHSPGSTDEQFEGVQSRGAEVMGVDRYKHVFEDLADGGRIELTADAESIRAIHEFLAFQRMDHRSHH